MRHFDEIYSLATENHGIVTAAAARDTGVQSKDLRRWVEAGRLVRVGYGVYRSTQYPASEEDQFAIAVEEVGRDAYLYGESVLALHGLAPTNVNFIHVATPVRCRKRLPGGYVIVKNSRKCSVVNVRGIRTQSVFDAILACKKTMMPERLESAASEGFRQGLLTNSEFDTVMESIKHDY